MYYVGDQKLPPTTQEKMEEIMQEMQTITTSEKDKETINRWQKQLEESFKQEIEKQKGGK